MWPARSCSTRLSPHSGRRWKRSARGTHPSQRLTEPQGFDPVLFQQRHRQSARYNDRDPSPHLRRRAGALSEPEDHRRAWRRLSGGYSGRSTTPGARAGTAHGDLPKPPRPISRSSMSTPSSSRRTSLPHWWRLRRRPRPLGTDYPYDMADYDPLDHISSGTRASMPRPRAALQAATRSGCWSCRIQ